MNLSLRGLAVVALSAIFTLGVAHAKKNCTDAPKEKWMKEADFKEKVIKDGYKIRKFKQPGTCYEIYGKNPEGKDVEIYFNPVDGTIVKQK
jgi:hypothetical protein